MAHLGRRLKVRVRSLTKVNSRHPHLQAPTIWNHSDSTLAIRIETGRCVKIRGTTVRESVLKPACIRSNFAVKIDYGQSGTIQAGFHIFPHSVCRR